VFNRAVAEAREIQDRRAGRTPKTDFEPVDFLTEAVEYAVTEVHMDFDEAYPPLADAEAMTMDSAAALGAVRRGARRSDTGGFFSSQQERLLLWLRYHLMPETVRRKMAPSHASTPSLEAM
jgi:hypothetical protein